MKEIELTQGKIAIVDDEDYERVSKHKWYYRKRYPLDNGYAGRKLNGYCILMHRFIMNPAQGYDIDHINGNGLDNRKENLRICTRAQNVQNQNKRRTNKSGYKGVDYVKQLNKYRTRVGTTIIGYYNEKEEAAKQYNIAALQMYGEFANLNII